MRWWFVALCVVLASCGENRSPIAPTPTPPVQTPPLSPPATVANIAGTWHGSMQFVFNHVEYSMNVSMTLQQDASDHITGSWRVTTAGNDIRGDVAGTLSGFGVETRIVGTMTFDGETETGTGRCFARASIDGTASPPSMRWTSQNGWIFETCDGAFSNVTLTWVR